MRRHVAYTNSPRAKRILENWPETLKDFIKVFPHEYKRILAKKPVVAEKPQPVFTVMGSALRAMGERA
jgi:glutamate synthase domain-containing protein 3